MSLNSKLLGAACLLACVVGSAAPAGAQAAGEFHLDGTPVALRGESTEAVTFTVFGGLPIKCSAVSFEGRSVAQTTLELALTPSFQACKGVIGGIGETKMNGCRFTLTGSAELTAILGIAGCTVGKRIELKAAFCTFTFPEQNLSHVVFENQNPGAGKEDETSTKHLGATFTISGLLYTAAGPSCPSPGEHSDGTFNAKVTLKAYQITEEKLVTKDGHQFTESGIGIGTQVGMFAT